MSFTPPLRHVVGSLRRAPVLSAGAVITFALGIGAAAAAFTVVNAVLLRPLPYRDPGRLVALSHTLLGLDIPDAKQSLGSFYFYRHNSRTLASVAAWAPAAVNLADAEGHAAPERVDGARISANLLATLGVLPERGRGFTAADEGDGVRVALIGHDLWRRRFGGDEAIIGRGARIDGDLYRIVGVLPAGFHYPYATTALWRPLQIDSLTPHAGSFNLGAVARLAPGATPRSAQLELNRLLPRLPESYPDVYAGLPMPQFLRQSKMTAVVRTLRDDLVGGYARALWVVAATVALLLIAACANVATLLLVRARGRVHELAVRAALGAEPRRLAAQSFGEAAVLAAAGGALGIGIAIGATRLLVRYGPADLPRLGSVHVDGATLAFTGLAAGVAALVCGALPALRSRAAPLGALLESGGRAGSMAPTQQRAHRSLIVVQVALAVVLLAGAGLLARSVARLSEVPPGFDARSTLAFSVSLPSGQYRHPADVARFYADALDRVKAIPGVTDAGVIQKLPLVGGERLSAVYVQGFPVKENTVPPVSPVPMASAGYFRAMHIPLVAGRLFTSPDDAEGANDIIVSRAFAERYWPDPTAALGGSVRMQQSEPWRTIVGVVESVRDSSLTGAPVSELYVPLRRIDAALPDSLAPEDTPRVMHMVLRTRGAPAALGGAVRRAIRGLDPGVPLYQVESMTRVVSRATARARFVMLALVAAALITVALGTVGLYGVIAYAVSFRRREMGVRLAVGAEPRALLTLVLRDGVGLAAAGLLLGLAAYAALARFLRGLLFEVGPADPVTLLAVPVLLLAVAAAASLAPAWRASRTDPLTVLRGD